MWWRVFNLITLAHYLAAIRYFIYVQEGTNS